MITGFNTDVEYQGVTYHVQTEDKGVSTPMIMSLVYVRGTIIASKRTPYEDLLNGKLDEKVLAERLQKQHKLICAAVTAGRIEDLKRMAAKDIAGRQKKPAPAPVQVPVPPPVPAPRPEVAAPVKVPPQPFLEASKNLADAIDRVKAAPVATSPPPRPAAPVKPPPAIAEPVPKPEQDLEWGFPIDLTEDDLIIDGVEIVDDELILPAEAVAVLGDPRATPASPASTKLGVDFVSETSFKGGERKTLGIVIYRGAKENPVASAQIMVKVLGSSFRPLIFHAKTDAHGVATVHLQLPHFKAGRAAVLVRAMSDGEEAEIRRRVAHG